MTFDNLEARTKERYFLEHVCSLPNEHNYVVAVVDLKETLNKALMTVFDQYSCPVCEGPHVYHMIMECPVLAASHR